MDNSAKLEEIAQRVKLHKQKEREWCFKRDEYVTKISKMRAVKAAHDLCLNSLESQINELRAKINAMKGIKEPVETPKEVKNEPQIPVYSQLPSVVQCIISNNEDYEPRKYQKEIVLKVPSKSSQMQAMAQRQAKVVQAVVKEVPLPTKSTGGTGKGKKKRATTKSAKPAAHKHTINIHLDSIRAVCFYNTLPIVVTASDDGTIRLTNCEPVSASGKKVHNPVNFASLRGHAAPVLCLSPFEDNGHQYMFSGCVDGTIALWDLPKKQTSLYEVKGRADHNKINEFEFHTDAVWSIATDGKHAISCSADGTAKYWSVCESPQTEDLSVPSLPVAVKNIEPGKFVVGCEDGKLIVFNGNVQEKTIDVGNHIFRMSDVVDSILAVTCGDQNFYVININDGSIQKIPASSGVVETAAITSDGKCYITGATDREVRVWASEGNSLLYSEVMHKEKFGECCICSAATTKNSKNSYFATGGAEGTLQIFTHN